MGKHPHSIPEHAAAAWAVRRFSIGERDGGDLPAVPAYTMVDALLGYEQGKWRYAINASNLFDKKYIGTCLERGDCLYGERRQVMASMAYRW